MIIIKNLTKVYNTGTPTTALSQISFSIKNNGMTFLLGKSGSGKTTLLNILGGLDSATEGEITVNGTKLSKLKGSGLDTYRSNQIGFVFQEYNLLDELTVAENVGLALDLQGDKDKQGKIRKALEQVDLKGFEKRKIGELSGGQKQRVAIARALIKNPSIILADEPTGALDSENSRQIFDILKTISAEKSVIVVSHDRDSAEKYADRIVELSDGRVISDSAKTEMPNEEEEPKNSEKKSHLHCGTVLKIAFDSAKRRRIRLSVIILLSLIAFMLLGVSDMITSFNNESALVNTYKGKNGNKITLIKSDSDSFIEPMWTDEQIDAFARKTNQIIKPIYSLPTIDLNIEKNYAISFVDAENAYNYVKRFTGFF